MSAPSLYIKSLITIMVGITFTMIFFFYIDTTIKRLTANQNPRTFKVAEDKTASCASNKQNFDPNMGIIIILGVNWY